MAARVTSSRLVGRGGELAELEAALADAAQGRPSLVFVAGESGVGKTRLLAELARRAEDAGARVLRGGGMGPGEEELPYGPLLGALRPLAHDGGLALEELPRAARAELGRLMPRLALGDAPAPDGEASQLRLFEALLTLIDRLGRDGPLVLVLEDLHWVDRSTRAFLMFLARALGQERALIVLTYRPEELHRRHPLRPVLAELERTERSRRLELAPLAPEELREVLADILGAPPSDEVLERLVSRSQGNPLYAEELLAADLDGCGAPPVTLSEALRIRMERLSPVAQQALRAVAVAGRVDQQVLGEATGLRWRELSDALREAVDAHVVAAEADGRIAFRHALLAEVAYDDLLPGERTELHLAFARAMEGRDGDPACPGEHIAAVAHHYLEAGDQPAAFGAALRAAEAARKVRAHADEAALLERALQLWARIPDAADRAGRDHAGLIALTAEAHLAGGDRARAEVLARRELEEVGEGRPHRAAGALWRVARAQSVMGRDADARETGRRALELLPPDDVSPERALLLGWWSRSQMLRGRYTDAIAEAEEALRVADALGDEHTRGRALNTIGFSMMAGGHIEEGAERLRCALEMAREQADPDELGAAYDNLAEAMHMAGRTDEAREILREGLTVVSECQGRRSHWLGLALSEYAFEAGDWDESAASMPDDGTRFVGRLQVKHELRRAEIALGQGEPAMEPLRSIAPLVAASGEAHVHGAYGALLAEARRRDGDLDGARAAVEDALDRLEFCTDDLARIARLAATGVTVEADRAQLARDRRDAADAKDAVARARSMMSRVKAASAAGGPVEQAWRAEADAELARARRAGDPARLAKSAAAWEQVGRPYRAAIARSREAEAHLEQGDRPAATAAGKAALETAGRLRSGWLEQELGGLAARGRLSLEAAEQEPAPAPVDTPFDLTPRELQVLRLIAGGSTNREIGAALYIAEKTASVHVSRILAKLGVRSRGQAAAVAHRLGIE